MLNLPLDKTNTSLSIVCYTLTIIGALGATSAFILHTIYPEQKDYQYIRYAIILGILLVIVSLFALLIIHIVSLKIKLKLTNIIIEGVQITSLGVANGLRTYNKDYKLHHVSHEVVIEGNSLIQDYICSGIKHQNLHNNNSFIFTIDADTNLTLADIDCYCYDLKHDSLRSRKIFPVLQSTDGQSKKVKVVFLDEVKTKSNFSVLIHTNIPDCMKKGRDYYISSLSFDENEKVDLQTIQLKFKTQLPRDVRVYEVLKNGSVKDLKTLSPDNISDNEAVFTDKYTETNSVKYLVYIFDRLF